MISTNPPPPTPFWRVKCVLVHVMLKKSINCNLLGAGYYPSMRGLRGWELSGIIPPFTPLYTPLLLSKEKKIDTIEC